MDPQDLNQLRSVDELNAFVSEAKGRQAELNREFDGLPFPPEYRDEFAGLEAQKKEAQNRVQELERRKEIVESNADQQRRIERLDEDVSRYHGRETLKEQDIYDMSTLRVDPMNSDRTRIEFRDRALRVIDVAKFPHLGRSDVKMNREDAQAHLESRHARSDHHPDVELSGEPRPRDRAEGDAGGLEHLERCQLGCDHRGPRG
jgi:chromosome segregation ATPase